MNKTTASVLTLLLLLATIASAAVAVFFYSQFNRTSSQNTTLQSQNEDLEEQVVTLEEAVDTAENQTDEDFDGDNKAGDTPIETPDDPCKNSSSDGEIIVTKPCIKDTIGSKFNIKGQARVFEATFQVSIVSSRGDVLFQKHYMTTGGDIGLKNPFDETVVWTSPGGGNGRVNFYENSPMDGSVQHLVSIPVKFE